MVIIHGCTDSWASLQLRSREDYLTKETIFTLKHTMHSLIDLIKYL